ncbi:MAG: prolipoprotein diacylglyceryl transferase [Legionellales bacterium]|nr:prolipoprotein diacylglyceryl transferase [Legionellales bacterium]|tara:strand:- start:402 stop:1208 length:807 start_codon:yes stop_codon:yes gene_type:complete
MLTYPQINPVIVHIGALKVRWYGVMYLIGFFSAWLLLNWRAKKKPVLGFNAEIISDLIFYGALGVIFGGRIGYMLFYDLPNFIANPLIFFKIWDGGMSFHGGFLGVLVAMSLYSWKRHYSFIAIMDFIAPVAPIGLAAGRIGNFINDELWGRVTDMPWAMVFPTGGPFPRHPSQLYEFTLEGVFLFILLWLYSRKPRPAMAVSALFLIGYGCARFFCEFFRQPDPQLGYLAFNWLTMGQVLSFPMIVLGIILMIFAYKSAKPQCLQKT